VSCLCVTENRDAFMPWLVWNYDKQDYAQRELVVVDSSTQPLRVDGEAVRVVHVPHGSSVARKRNLALEAARGEIVAWFDDDDWQHPSRLSRLVAALGADGLVAGAAASWFVDLARGRARAHAAHHGVVFNSAAVRRAAVEDTRFDERKRRAADTGWMAALERRARRGPIVVDAVLSFWLCHRANISNPATRYVFPQTLRDVEAQIGAKAWGDTTNRIDALRERLATRPSR
jgi:glycosyltransferase involved in cell wall biosynthesis